MLCAFGTYLLMRTDTRPARFLVAAYVVFLLAWLARAFQTVRDRVLPKDLSRRRPRDAVVRGLPGLGDAEAARPAGGLAGGRRRYAAAVVACHADPGRAHLP